jgi:hypothetical protein
MDEALARGSPGARVQIACLVVRRAHVVLPRGKARGGVLALGIRRGGRDSVTRVRCVHGSLRHHHRDGCNRLAAAIDHLAGEANCCASRPPAFQISVQLPTASASIWPLKMNVPALPDLAAPSTCACGVRQPICLHLRLHEFVLRQRCSQGRITRVHGLPGKLEPKLERDGRYPDHGLGVSANLLRGEGDLDGGEGPQPSLLYVDWVQTGS